MKTRLEPGIGAVEWIWWFGTGRFATLTVRLLTARLRGHSCCLRHKAPSTPTTIVAETSPISVWTRLKGVPVSDMKNDDGVELKTGIDIRPKNMPSGMQGSVKCGGPPKTNAYTMHLYNVKVAKCQCLLFFTKHV